jgi:hypothetical protein
VDESEVMNRSMREKIDLSFLTLKSSGRLGVSRLRRFASFASVFLLIGVVSLSGATFAHAQSQGGWTATGWVSGATISDLTGNAPLTQNQPLIAGHSYNTTLTIVVPNTSTSTSTFQVSLNPKFIAALPIFWAIHTANYPGYNMTGFSSGSKLVTFNYDQGTLRLSANFQVPVNFTNPTATFVTPSGNVSQSIHLTQNNVIIVSVVPVGSTSAGAFDASISDQTIQTYLTNYNQTANLVPTGKISQTYSPLVTSILNEAQALYKLGFPDQGTALLGSITTSAFPVPPSGSLQTELLVGLAAAVVVVVLLAVMMLRSRGKSGYSVAIINEVQKELAVLEVTAAKYDRAMADKLKSLRNKLSESS